MDVFGTTVLAELKENGAQIDVTKENREEYVELYTDYLLNKSVQRSFDAFHKGFRTTGGGSALHLFS